jgi:hypothetical protein
MNASHEMPYLRVVAAKPGEDGGDVVLDCVLDLDLYLRHRDGRKAVRKALERAGLPSSTEGVDAAIAAVLVPKAKSPEAPKKGRKRAE